MSLADVTSANIVGYNTVTIKAGKYNMFAVNFENVSDTDGISIQDLIPGTTEGLFGGTAATGDQIQIYNSETGNYKNFYLQYSTVPLLMKNNWKWIDGTAVASYKFKSGDSFWYRSRGSTDVTVSLAGGVSLAPAQTIEIVEGYNMIGNAFPVNFNPNSLGTSYWESSGAVGGTAATGDQIQIFNPETGNYKNYYLQYSTVPLLMKNNWKWIDGTTPVDAAAEVMSVGKGAWYRHRGTGFTLTIASPIAK